MVQYYFALLMIFISVYAMEQDNKLEVDSLSWPDVYIRHSKPWFKSLCNWAKCYYQMKVLYENANRYQIREQEQGNNGKSNTHSLMVMQSWLQWCKPELKKIIDDPNELYLEDLLYERRLLNVALKKNRYCLGKFLITAGADPLLDCGLFSTMFYARDLKWAKLFLSAVDDNANRVSKDFSLIMHVIDKNYPEEVLKLYLEHDGDPNFSSKRGNALHWLVLVSKKYIENVSSLLSKTKLLIAHKVQINRINKYCHTPLDIANQQFNEEVNNESQQHLCAELIALLRKHGAKTAKELQLEQQ